MSNALSVAKELVKLSFAGDEPDPLTNLRLQKLLYYAQAWSLVVRESELFSERLEAWRWGPVVPPVSHRLSDEQGANVITPDRFAAVPDLSPEEAAFVRPVWAAYKGFSAAKLSEMTHREMPWKKAWGDRPSDGSGNDEIDVSDMEEFFSGEDMPASLAKFAHERWRKEEAVERALADLPPIDRDRFRAFTRSRTPAAVALRNTGS